MYGAILGDIIGSPYEFYRGNKTKEFELFSEDSVFTDDTVMTVAVAEALMDAGTGVTGTEMKERLVKSMQKWGRKYSYAGYGGMFYRWLFSDMTEPYNSFGNGSAMRVSSVGWLYDTLEKTREVARWTAEVTHNHPEGVKGAEAVASVIFMARNGADKSTIKRYVEDNFGYDLSRTCDEIRQGYRNMATCQNTVPEAVTAFLEGQDFETVIRTAVSLGGDCDTLADIAGAMGEAFYGVPVNLQQECEKRIGEDMKAVLKRFYRTLRQGEYPQNHMADFWSDDISENTIYNAPELDISMEDLYASPRFLKNSVEQSSESDMPMKMLYASPPYEEIPMNTVYASPGFVGKSKDLLKRLLGGIFQKR
ncbi:MAG: ADP-ribosylglycohydrolase family protein [Lachnospiraceae bacterium]|nr:ADP-ribosylglycohydrolase family protein [Lachnospiraceae bacterium]